MDFSTYSFYVIKMCWEAPVYSILFLSCDLLPVLFPFKKPRENFLGVVSCLVIMQNQLPLYFSSKKPRSGLRQNKDSSGWSLNSFWVRKGRVLVCPSGRLNNLKSNCGVCFSEHPSSSSVSMLESGDVLGRLEITNPDLRNKQRWLNSRASECCCSTEVTFGCYVLP